MNEVELMERTGYDLVCWKPDTQDWVLNRKYIAVLKENGCHWIESKKGEGFNSSKKIEATNQRIVFSFVDFVGFDFDDRAGIFMVFEKEDRQTGILLNHCNFFKNDKPPVLKDIENKLKQNQI